MLFSLIHQDLYNLNGRIIQNGLYYVDNVINSFITSATKLKRYYLFDKKLPTPPRLFFLSFSLRKSQKDKTAIV